MTDATATPVAKKLLIIDDAFDLLSKQFEDRGYEVISTGPTMDAFTAMMFIGRLHFQADFILLDMQLGQQNDAGAKIAGILPPEVKAKTIGISGETIAKQVLRSLGITHTPGKNPDDVIACMEGRCDCQKQGKKNVEFKSDILIAAHGAVLASLKKVLSIIQDERWKIIYCEDKPDEVGKALLEHRPRLFVYHISDYMVFPYGNAEHSYSHLRIADSSLPPFENLFGEAVITSAVPDDEMAERAKKLGHKIVMPLDVVNLLTVIHSLLGKDRSQEWEMRAEPIFGHPNRDVLINIARTMSPSSTYEAVFARTRDEAMAKACRYLSIIRRDYGIDKFEQVVLRHS